MDNASNVLLNFAKKLEQNKIVNPETGIKIRGFIRKTEEATYWEIILVVSGVLGALFCSAGIFSIISHNWYDLNEHVRGFFSLVPVAVALYFYYLAIFKHKDSKTWVEASSLFLMLMIGASMALISQTYHMNGDYLKFIKVWLVLTLPLFYIAKASVISFFYLALACILLSDIEYNYDYENPSIVPFVSNGLYWFWLYVLAFIPHFYLALKKDSKKQSIRIVFMSFCMYAVLLTGLIFTVKSNFILWFATFNVAAYLFGKQFMGDNKWVILRPLQVLSQFAIVYMLIALSFKWAQFLAFNMDSIMRFDTWEDQEVYSFILLLVVMGGVYYNFFRDRENFGQFNYLVVFTPFLIIFAMLFHDFVDSWWWSSLFINFYILFLGITMMIHSSTDGKPFKMIVGLTIITILLWIRYFDNDLGFIAKGIVFLGVGGMFFMMNLLIKDKVEDIERHKKLSE